MFDMEKADALFGEWQKGVCPGGQVLMRYNGETVYEKCFGYADIERSVPVTPETVFHVASISKQITSMCVLLLEEDGKLSIDDDVRKYISDMIKFPEPVTLRDMMQNVSGIRDQWDLQIFSGTLIIDEIDQRHLNYLNGLQQSLNFEPRSRYLYSNANFSMLAEVVARVSKKSFNEFAEERIFRPLGMENTLFRERSYQIIKNRALSYGTDGDGFRWMLVNFSNYGATSLHTTARDFAKWLANFKAPSICKPETLERMQTPATLLSGEATDYACGIGVPKFEGRRTVQHGGADGGYRSHAMAFPDDGLEIAVFSNIYNVDVSGAAYALARLWFGIEPSAQPERGEYKPPEKLEFTEEEKKAFVGVFYSPEVETFYTIIEKDGGLFARHRRHGIRRIEKLSDNGNVFYDISGVTRASFILKDGVADEISFHSGRVTDLRFKRTDIPVIY